MFVSGIKKPLLIVSLVLAVALAACGDFDDDYSQSNKIGPSSSPTVPGGYYFDMTVSPSVVQLGATDSIITVTTHVWDANGVGVSGVTVSHGGDLAVVDGTTDSSGYYIAPATVTGVVTEVVVGYLSVKIEDVDLTVSYRVIPEGGI